MTGETLDPEYDSSLGAQTSWFNAVVKENEGKYDYIIAFQHYAYLDGTEVKYGHYDTWRKIYDEVGVDFALGSDSHEYSRTFELYKGSRILPEENGTVYVTSPMTEGSSLSPISNTYGENGSGVSEFYGGWGVGGSYFVVRTGSMTMYTIGANGRVYDKKTVGRKKRDWN